MVLTLQAAALGAAGIGLGLGVLAAYKVRHAASAVPVPTAKVKQIIIREMSQAGSKIPVWYGLTCAALESGFDEGAVGLGPRDDSHGLYQINLLVPDVRAALAAEGLTKQDLYDPAINAHFWRVHMAQVFRAGAVSRGYSGDALWEAVRLRLGGIGWTYIAGGGTNQATIAKVAQIKARLWRYAARFR